MISIQKIPNVLQELRVQTRIQHARLESILPWESICSDVNVYSDFLLRFYGFFVTWEAELEMRLSEEASLFWRPRRKARVLHADLSWLGRSDLELAACPRLDPASLGLQTYAACLGSLYVIEGATLGGQIIARAVEAKLGLSEAGGAAYFHSYGSNIPQAWAEFRDFLGRQIATEEQCQQAVEGARTTFSVLENWLTGGRG